MAGMDLDTAVAETERFLAAWNDECMTLLGGVIVQAGLGRNAPELTTTHLHALLDAIHAQQTAPARRRPVATRLTALMRKASR